MVDIGVIGAGGMGSRHARNLAALGGVEVVAVADPDLDRAQRLASGVEAKHVYADPGALVANAAVQAVVVASPDETHADLALACIEEGKPVLCEKPLATTAAGAWRVVEAELEAARRYVQVGFMRRFDPAHQKLVGAPGEPLRVSVVHLNPGGAPSRSVRELVFQSMIHDIDTLRFVSGHEITRVDAQVAPTQGLPMVVTLTARLDNGSLGSVAVHVESDGYEVVTEAMGRGWTWRTESSPAADWLVRFQDAYLSEVEAFAAGCESGSIPGPSAWDGYQACVVAEACVTSAHTAEPCSISLTQPPPLYS